MYCNPETSDEVLKIIFFIKENNTVFKENKEISTYMIQNAYFYITFIDNKIGFSHIPIGEKKSVDDFIKFVKEDKK